ALLKIGTSPFTIFLELCRDALDDKISRRNTFRNIDHVKDPPLRFTVLGDARARYSSKRGDVFLPRWSGRNFGGFCRTCWARRFRLRVGEVVRVDFFILVKGPLNNRIPGRSDSRKVAVRLGREQRCVYMLAKVFTLEITAVAFDDNFLTI